MCGTPGAAEVAGWFVHNDGMRESRTHECGKFWIAEFDMCVPAKTPTIWKTPKNSESQCIFRNFNYIQYVHPIGSWRIGKLTDTWFISTNNWFCCGCCCCVVAVRGSIRNLVVQSSEFREELQTKRNNLRCGCCGDGFGWNKFGTCSHERCCCWGSRHL